MPGISRRALVPATSSSSASSVHSTYGEKLAAASRGVEALLRSDGNWTRTTAMAKLDLGELLVMWANALDIRVEEHEY